MYGAWFLRKIVVWTNISNFERIIGARNIIFGRKRVEDIELEHTSLTITFAHVACSVDNSNTFPPICFFLDSVLIFIHTAVSWTGTEKNNSQRIYEVSCWNQAIISAIHVHVRQPFFLFGKPRECSRKRCLNKLYANKKDMGELNRLTCRGWRC